MNEIEATNQLNFAQNSTNQFQWRIIFIYDEVDDKLCIVLVLVSWNYYVTINMENLILSMHSQIDIEIDWNRLLRTNQSNEKANNLKSIIYCHDEVIISSN